MDDLTNTTNVKNLIKSILDEIAVSQQKQAEPAYKRELGEERAKRESLEQRLNEVIEENNRAKATADSLHRESRIKAELQKQGVSKLDLAYKAIKDDIVHEPDGALIAKSQDGNIPLKDFLKTFLEDNPELLPARNTTGSGATNSAKMKSTVSSIDLDSIHPGMSREEMARARQEIARIANQITN